MQQQGWSLQWGWTHCRWPSPWCIYLTISALLEATLLRCAVGALATTPRLAAQLILAANIGVALGRIAQPSFSTTRHCRSGPATPASPTPRRPADRIPSGLPPANCAPHSRSPAPTSGNR